MIARLSGDASPLLSAPAKLENELRASAVTLSVAIGQREGNTRLPAKLESVPPVAAGRGDCSDDQEPALAGREDCLSVAVI